MVGLHIWFVIFTYENLVSSELMDTPSRTNSGLPREDARECYEELQKDSDISHLLLDVTGPEKIDEFCGRISKLKQCIANSEHQLSNEENTKYLQKTRGISDFYLNVCPPGTDITSKYKGNAPCFQTIKNKILSCGSDLPDMASYKMQNDLNSRCCALHRHRICTLEATGENCGRPAAEVMDQILKRYFKQELVDCPSKIPNACSYQDSENEITSKKPNLYHDKDYYTNEDYHTSTDYNERETHNSAIVLMSTFLHSLMVILLHLF